MNGLCNNGFVGCPGKVPLVPSCQCKPHRNYARVKSKMEAARGQGPENIWIKAVKNVKKLTLANDLEPSISRDNSCLETMDSMKNMDSKATIIISAPCRPGLNSLYMESLDKMKSKPTSNGKSFRQNTKLPIHSNKDNSGPKPNTSFSWSHRLTAKKTSNDVKETKQDDLLKDDKKESKVMTKVITNTDVLKEKKQVTKSWSHRLAAKHQNISLSTTVRGI